MSVDTAESVALTVELSREVNYRILTIKPDLIIVISEVQIVYMDQWAVLGYVAESRKAGKVFFMPIDKTATYAHWTMAAETAILSLHIANHLTRPESDQWCNAINGVTLSIVSLLMATRN